MQAVTTRADVSLFHHYDRWREHLDYQAAWWDDPSPTRPLVLLRSPADAASAPAPWDIWCFSREPDAAEKHCTDFAAHATGYQYHLGAVPFLNPNFAAGVLATLINGEFDFQDDTVWVERAMEWDELTDVHLDENDIWWQRLMRSVTVGVEHGIVTATPDIGGTLDVCAAIRGTQNLLYEVSDCPERVLALVDDVQRMWFDAFDRLYAPMEAAYGGSVNRWGFFAAGKQYPLQCDFAAMLSPAMFERFVLPALVAECEYLDYGIYHLDGPGQICHLDMLLDIPNMRVIQWVPGTGNPGNADPVWCDMYRKIQRAGRALVLGGGIEALDLYMNELDPGLLQLTIWARDEREVEHVMERVGSG